LDPTLSGNPIHPTEKPEAAMAFRLASAGIRGSIMVNIVALKILLADPAEGNPAERTPELPDQPIPDYL
jgi:hypothetical protein